MLYCVYVFFFFKQKTAYEMRISDWSSDVCSSDLLILEAGAHVAVDVGRLPMHILRAAEAEVQHARGDGRVGELVDQDEAAEAMEIGRASCRERVCQYV